MMAGGDLIGVVEVLNKKAPEGFTEADKSLLESLASLAALAIANARLIGGFRNFYSNTIGYLRSKCPRKGCTSACDFETAALDIRLSYHATSRFHLQVKRDSLSWSNSSIHPCNAPSERYINAKPAYPKQ